MDWFLDCCERFQKEKYLSFTLHYSLRNTHASTQRPSAELDIYFRVPVALSYSVWILNRKGNGKVRNVSRVLFISPTSGKQLLKNKLYMV